MLRKSIVTGIILLFLLSSISPFAYSNEVSSNNIIYVDDVNTEGPWDGTQEHPYQHIQDAIDNASDGDTIFVYNGIYYENLYVDKSITLEGEDKNTTIIDGEFSPKWHNVVEINVDFVEIKQFTIQNSRNYMDGISVESNHSIITNNIFKDNSEGIECSYQKHNTISKNIFVNNYRGIVIRDTKYIIITQNLFNNCSSGIVGFLPSHYINITFNTISNCRYSSFRLYGSRNNISFNKILSNNDEGIYIGGNFNIVSNNIIENNTDSGIYYSGGKNNSILNNIIKNNGDNGISFRNIKNSSIENNNIIGNSGVGLYFLYGEGNIITKNLIQDSDRFSISVRLSPCNQIKNNNFIDNYGGSHYVNCDNIWRRNYYEKPRILPYIISGTYQECPLQIDWFPRLTPYKYNLDYDNYE